MTKHNDTLATTRARLDIIEAKLDQLLKKFGFADEDLWDFHRNVYEKSLEQPRNDEDPLQVGDEI